LAANQLLSDLPTATADVMFVSGAASMRLLGRRAVDLLRATAGPRAREVDLALLKRELADYDVCLDGIFGFQFRPPLEESAAELLAWVNTHPRIRLRAAVDLPSGLGEVGNGKTVFRADFTYCTGIVKTPVITPANAAYVGRARYVDLGFFASRAPRSAAAVLRAALLRPLGGLRAAQSDKRTFGHVLIVGGSLSYPGAVLMTVQAALRSGVGLLTAAVPAPLVPEYAAKFPEVMWIGWAPNPDGGLPAGASGAILSAAKRATAVVLGPGLGALPEALASAAAIARETSLPMLLDADALRPEILHAALSGGGRLVLTPHAGEWQRLGGEEGLAAAAALAPSSEMIVVRKGVQTRLDCYGPRRESAETCYSLFGGPVLARGGSGDLLAGLIGGRIAQNPADLWLAAAQGVVWHGLAADLLARDKGQVAVQTTQLLDYLQLALHCAEHDTT
jgi:NAD(P)H-hydrate epimerase